MTDTTTETTEIARALESPNASIRFVLTMGHGAGLQVFTGRQKVGPLLLPNEGESTADVLRSLAGLLELGAGR